MPRRKQVKAVVKYVQNKPKAKAKAVKDVTAEMKKLAMKEANANHWRHMGAGTGAAIGTLLGGGIGGTIGYGIGGLTGAGLSYITGNGDYTTNFDAVTPGVDVGPPAFKAATIVAHREYLGDVISSSTAGAFSMTSFPLNPGQRTTFPWLSTMAQNFDEYEILGMVFEFKSISGDSVASTNTSIGTVILATQYDPTKPAFQDKQEMENYEFAMSCKPSVSCLHAIECKKSLSPVKTLYVRTGATSVTGPDLRWSDFGTFSVATVGQPGTSVNLGELWVSYKIALRKPRLAIGGVSIQYQQHIFLAGADTTHNLGSTVVYNAGTLGVSVTPAGGVLSWRAQPTSNYLIVVMWTTVASFSAPPSVAGTGIAFSSPGWIDNGGTSARQVKETLSNGTFVGTFNTTITAPGVVSLAFTNITMTLGSPDVDIFITQLDTTIG